MSDKSVVAENYITLDAKYRPRYFGQIYGQPIIVSTLKGMFRSGRISRSYGLFGPYGSGKTTSARLIAKMCNCEDPDLKKVRPCGKCKSCKTFTSGGEIENNNSIHEMNMADKTGVNDVRALLPMAKLLPTFKYRIFILDEVHRCFLGDTKVLVDYDKAVSIKDIYENPEYTHVLSYDLKAKKIVKRKILDRMCNDYKGRWVNIHIGNKSIKTTFNHPFYVVGKGWVNAGELKKNDVLKSYDGNLLDYRRCSHCGEYTSELAKHKREKHGQEIVGTAIEAFINNHDVKVTKIEIFGSDRTNKKAAKTYNLSVFGTQNYFACLKDEGSGRNLLPVLTHNCTSAAQAALLKILEEPPKRTIFIIATTNPEKLEKTILSRCKQLMIKPLQTEDTVKLLTRVCSKEGIKVHEKVLTKIAMLTDNHPRDSLKTLESVFDLIQSGKKISSKSEVLDKVIQDITGVPPWQLVSSFLFSIYRGSFMGAFRCIEKLDNFDYFMKECMRYHSRAMMHSMSSDKLPYDASFYKFDKEATGLFGSSKIKVSDSFRLAMADMLTELVSTASQMKDYLVAERYLLQAAAARVVPSFKAVAPKKKKS